jgi:hypothetical protein
VQSDWKKYGDGGLTIEIPKETSSKKNSLGNIGITANISFGNLSPIISMTENRKKDEKDDKFSKMNDILLENESIWTNDWSFDSSDQCDKDGWMYSNSWKDKKFSSDPKNAKVRTRKWIRSQRKINHVLLKQIGLDPTLFCSPKFDIVEPFAFKK